MELELSLPELKKIISLDICDGNFLDGNFLSFLGKILNCEFYFFNRY